MSDMNPQTLEERRDALARESWDCGYYACSAVACKLINQMITTQDEAKERPEKPTIEVSQHILEDWWNEDAEMRYAEIMCGENRRVMVRLFQIDMDPNNPDGSIKAGECEAGTLSEALLLATAEARGLQVCPNCAKPARFEAKQSTHTETHGLDCGPYETINDSWLECNECRQPTNEQEI